MNIGWAAAVINVIGLYLLGRKHKGGWLLGIAAEMMWVARAAQKEMPELMAISGVYCIMAGLNYIKWEQGKRNDDR